MTETIRLRRITEKDIDNLPVFPDGRDTIGKEYRRQLQAEAMAAFEEHKDDGGDPGFSCQLVSGEKGVGKSNLMSSLALGFLMDGYQVVSNMSLLFGFHIESAVDIFSFSKIMPGRLLLVLDEIHALLSRYRQSSLGQREFVEGLAGLRKQRIHLLAGTSQEPELAMNFLRECDYIIYPKKPKRYPQMGRGEAHYPAWCHLRIEKIGPRPLQGQTVGEKFFGIRPTTRPKRRRMNGITPQNIYQAAALQSSFAALPKGKEVGTHVTADQMRSALDEAEVITFDAISEIEEPAEAVREVQMKADVDVLEALYPVMEAAKHHRTISFDYLMTQATRYHVSYSAEDVDGALRRWLNWNGKGKINVEGFLNQFTRGD